MKDSSPITDLEYGILVKLSGARFPPATASKRFVRDWSNGYIKQLSPRGRKFLAFIAHRYRRQYRLSDPEQAWVAQWLEWEPPAPLCEPLRSLLDSLPCTKI